MAPTTGGGKAETAGKEGGAARGMIGPWGGREHGTEGHGQRPMQRQSLGNVMTLSGFKGVSNPDMDAPEITEKRGETNPNTFLLHALCYAPKNYPILYVPCC